MQSGGAGGRIDDMTLDYGGYLRLDQLLRQQQPRSEGPAHDELLFIVVHQAYELWFKLCLHEGEALRRALQAGEASTAQLTLKRLVAIQRLLNRQIEVLETMTPAGFAAFRGVLGTASGFQSRQFRELEILWGLRDLAQLQHHTEKNRDVLERRMSEPSVPDALLEFLRRQGHALSAESSPAEVQAALLAVLRGPPGPAQLVCEGLIDVDEAWQEWRYRHVKLVERFIGTRQGTGGSDGAAYLRDTLFRPLFPDLWEVRSELCPQTE